MVNKFEVYTSLKEGMNGTEAFLLSQKAVNSTFSEVIAALCMYKHKTGLNENDCIGLKISNEGIILLFKDK